MQDHIRDSLNRFEYSPQLRETAVFRILFDGQELSQVVTDLGIHMDLQQYSGDFLRQPSERCKNRTLVVPESGNADLNAAVVDYTKPRCIQRWPIELQPGSGMRHGLPVHF